MTTSNEQATKLPLMKRIVLAVRGGVPSGLSAMLVVLLLALVVAIGAGGFLGGLALATKRNQTMERNLLTQTRNAKHETAKLAKEKAELEHGIEELKEKAEMQLKDMATLKEQLDRAVIERETMEKVLAEIRDSLSTTGGNSKAEKVLKGALLKFGDKECALEGGAVKSKADLDCLNLRDAIGAMNSAPGGYADKNAKPAEVKAPAAKPEVKTDTAHKPASGH